MVTTNTATNPTHWIALPQSVFFRDDLVSAKSPASMNRVSHRITWFDVAPISSATSCGASPRSSRRTAFDFSSALNFRLLLSLIQIIL